MYDVIVVGGGPAGLSAALMLGRCRRRVLVCDLGQPRNRHSHAVHGYLTRDGVSPSELNELGRAELTKYAVECRSIGVVGATWCDDRFRVELGDGGEETSRYLLLATGVVDDLPAIGGLDACYGRSVFHCPYCDGWEVRDRQLAVIGIGNDASGMAGALKTWSDRVLLCSHGRRVDAAVREKLARGGIDVRTERIAALDHDDGMLHAIRFETGDPAPCDALFFTTGQHPQSDLAIRLGCRLTKRGTVKTGTLSNTNVPNVFVAGDASRDAQFVVVAAAEGIKAAVAINQALQRQEIAP